MVGLVGIVAQKNDIDFKKLLLQMSDSIRHKDNQKVDSYICENQGFIGMARVHLGIFNPESQPTFNEDKTVCIIMDGEIYDHESVKAELVSKGHKFLVNNDVEFVLHLYEEYGKNFIHKLNGIFTLVIWNDTTQELLIANDRYGLRPLYYTDDNGYLLYGSEVKSIIQDVNLKRDIDNVSIAEWFSFGYILGDKTFFQKIRLLPPASILTYAKREKISIEKYWDFDFNRKYHDHSEEYYIENLSKLMIQSMERQMKGSHKKSVLLSGGLDSRAIIGSIHKRHYPIETLTYGRPGCYDAIFAKMISDKLGTNHHFFDLKPDDMIKYIEDVNYVSDGMLNILNANWLLSDIIENMSKFSDVSYHGWIGDTITGSTYLVCNLSNNDDNFSLFKRLCNNTPIDILKNLFRDSYFPTYEQSIKKSKEYISHIGNNIDIPENRLTYINLKERQRRLISAGFVYMRNFLEFRTPFTDYDYVDFNMEIPPKYKIKKYIYKKMILKMFPDLRDIPFQKTGLPLYETNYLKTLLLFKEGIQILKKVMNNITRKTLGIEIFIDQREFVYYDKWMRTNENLRKYISDILLDNRTLSRHYFNKKSIKNILDSHLSGKKDYSILIGLLITFELWNRKFIDIENGNTFKEDDKRIN